MSFYDRVVGGLKNQMLLSDEVKRTAANVDRLQHGVFDHEKRLIRLETLVEVARGEFNSRRLPPD